MLIRISLIYCVFVRSLATTEAGDTANKREPRYDEYNQEWIRRFLRPMKPGTLYDARNDRIIENNFKCQESSARKLCPSVNFREIWKPQSLGVLSTSMSNGYIRTESRLQEEEDNSVSLDERLSLYAGLVDPRGGYGSWFLHHKSLFPGMQTLASKNQFSTKRSTLSYYWTIWRCCEGAFSYAKELGATHYVDRVVYGNVGVMVLQTPKDVVKSYNVDLKAMSRNIYVNQGAGDKLSEQEFKALNLSKIQMFSDACPGIGGEYIKPDVLLKCVQDLYKDEQPITVVRLVPIEYKDSKSVSVYQISKGRAEKVELMVRSLLRAEQVVNLKGLKVAAFREGLLGFKKSTLANLKDILPKARVDSTKESELDVLIAEWNSSNFSAEILNTMITRMSATPTPVG